MTKLSKVYLATELVDAIERYNAALAANEISETKYQASRAELNEATNALGRIAVPASAIAGENFNVWLGSRLLTVRAVGPGQYSASWREGGKV